jgi:hypothetical protein
LPTGRRRARVVLLAGALLALLAGLVTGAAVRAAVAAADDLQRARTVLQTAAVGEGGVRTLRDGLAQASAHLARADRRLDRAGPRLLSSVPVVGRSWRAEREVLALATAVVEGGGTALDVAGQVRAPDGAIDTRALRRTGQALQAPADRARAARRALAQTPLGLTPPVVRDGVREALALLGPAAEGLGSAARGAQLGASLLGGDGPRTVLVALGNNAELRGTVGYVSTFATGSLAGGRLELSPFQDVVDVHDSLDELRTVAAPADFVADYGPYYADTTDWRYWTMTPDAPTAAVVGAQVAHLLVGARPDVVVFLDVPAVAALTALTGQPVRLPDGTTVQAAGLVEALLVDTYAAAGQDEADQGARRRALSAAAGQTAAQLFSADLDLSSAARELGRLGAGRHLAVWSAREDEQEVLVDLGLAGAVAAPGDEVADDLCLVTVNNLTANKLGYWQERTVHHQAVLGRERAEVTQTVRLRDASPDGLVPYVLGITTPGTSSLRVEFSVPPGADVDELTVDGAPASGDVRRGPDRTRALTFVPLSRGQTVEVELRYSLPMVDGHYDLRVVPQALARDATLSIDVRAADGDPVEQPEGFVRDGEAVRRVAPFDRAETVGLGLARPGGFEGVRRRIAEFWQQPVPVP